VVSGQGRGKPNLNPDCVIWCAASEYVEGEKLVDLIKEDLIAERIAVERSGRFYNPAYRQRLARF
jgi:hypothetical protein